MLSQSYDSDVKKVFRIRDYTVDVGTYTGTGNDTSQTIDTGGTGRVATIIRVKYLCYCHKNGVPWVSVQPVQINRPQYFIS